MNNKIIGYTCGTFDLFHVGHLNILRNAKSMCDHLIVGVSTDKACAQKNKKPVMTFENRIEIVRSIKYVDTALPQNYIDRSKDYKKLKYNILFVGDDYYDKSPYRDFEKELNIHGVEIIYFPYTEDISTTKIKKMHSCEKK